MILYFDSYITDIPLPGRSRDQLKEDIRKNCEAYKMPKRIDIAKYTLASYALYPWSYVLIRYELDNPKEYKEFDKYIKSLFPKAKIMHKRSDNQKEYRKSIKILEKYNDDWIFYAPNNDHPIISSDPNIAKYIDKLIKIAEKWRKKYEYVSIIYSHFSEFLNLPIKGTPENYWFGKNTQILEDSKAVRIYKMPEGEYASVQIIHKNLFSHWFNSVNTGTKKIIRAEDILLDVKVANHIIITSKKEICAHFDGYEHTLGYLNEIWSDQVPPLFIPKGFFENKAKIAYGYNDYRKGWININPCVKKYSFRDSRHGTDLKLSLDDIPLFWNSHICEVDINSKMRQEKLLKDVKNEIDIKINPWRLKSQGINLSTFHFWRRYFIFKTNIFIRSNVRKILVKTKFL